MSFSSFGRILARHYNLPYISELDGYTVRRIAVPESGPGRPYGGSGGQIWTVDAAGLFEYRDDDWIHHALPEVANLFATRSPRSTDPLPMLPLRRHLVLCMFPDQLVQYNFEGGIAKPLSIRRAASTPVKNFLSMAPARDGGVWISGEGGLTRLVGNARNVSPQSRWIDWALPAHLGVSSLQGPREDDQGRVVMVGDKGSEKAVVVFDGQRWTARSAGSERLRSAWAGPDGRFWATTIAALKQGETRDSELVNTEQVSARQFLDVAVEPGGAFWLATSDGLLRYALLPWSVPSGLRQVRSLARSLAADEAGNIWFAAAGELCSFGKPGLSTRPLPAEVLRDFQGCYPAADNLVYLATSSQIWSLSADGTSRRLIQASPQETVTVLGKLRDRSLCVCRSSPGPEGSGYRFELLEGAQVRNVPWPRLQLDLGSRLHTVSQTRDGEIWLAGDRGLACLREKRWTAYHLPDSDPAPVSHFLETPEGTLLCATRDGIWQRTVSDWVLARSGFDQINTLMQSRDSSIWVGSNSGLFRFLRGQWIECGTPEGLPDSNVRQLVEDSLGNIWAATPGGLARFFPENDRDPPRTLIRKLPGNPEEPERSVTMAFVGSDKWKQTVRERLLYSYRIDDQEWSLFGESTEVFLDELSAGKHVFQVRAMDRNLNVETDPARLEFSVVLPWYQEKRLLIIALLGLLTALFFAGLAVNRHRKLVRSYALVERKVAERTRELEHASLQLLHSQKMNALGTLAAGVAHDFNNILSVIKGSAQIIEENLDRPEKVRARLDRIKMVVEQGAETIRAMLGFSRETDGQPVVCDVREIAEDTIRLLGERLIREAPVKLKAEANLPPVKCSRDLVQQILFNLVFNAAESQTGSKGILISTRLLDRLPENLVLAPEAARAYAGISIQDWGTGIPPENLTRIFEPFFTTKALSARRGTGLGLSMVYELARKLGAGLAVISIPGTGSTFTLLLPLADNQPRPASEVSSETKPLQ